MKFPWLKPKVATVEDLQKQLATAEADSEATVKALETAIAAFEAADDRFIESDTAKNREARRTAEEDRVRAHKVMERAVSIVGDIKVAIIEAEHAELERQRDALKKQATEDTSDADLSREEAAALAAFVKARLRRFEALQARSEREDRINQLNSQLGLPTRNVHWLDLQHGRTAHSEPVVKALTENVGHMPPNTQGGRCVAAVIQMLERTTL